jgi:uncharacterized protein YbbC (DUF1343 family)
MVKSGLDIVSKSIPARLKGKRIGLLCHAPSIATDFRHITSIFSDCREFRLTAIFGPQHGLFGQTQDNMIEWEGTTDPILKIPVFSLYGTHRTPSQKMLQQIDVLVIDLQDAGARLYTYAWTLKLCMEACSTAGIPVFVLDRPNPVGRVPIDGPVLKREFFTFVGGAEIPLCHGMTIGEIALWLKNFEVQDCDLNVIFMEGWNRKMLHSDTGIPWVLPSPNLPTQKSAIVYPGTVLIEALNISEGRGSTIPFELFGAPNINGNLLKKDLDARRIPGCAFRIHNFIPTFNKYSGEFCEGIQIHVTDPSKYYPVGTALEIFDSIIRTSADGAFKFLPPPYEYEESLMPFDILSGDSVMRKVLENKLSLKEEKERWKYEISEFLKIFRAISAYHG